MSSPMSIWNVNTAIVIVGLFSLAFAGLGGSAHAGNELDKCNDVLKGDIQDRINTSSQTQSVQQAAAYSFFNAATESQAFDEYKNEASKIDFSKLGEGDQGHLDAHYGLIGGAVDFAHSYDHEMGEDEFRREYSKHQNEYKQRTEQSSSSSSSSGTSLASAYASTIRDKATVEAWKDCMVKNVPQAGITALGFRDESGEPFVNIFWVPGDLVGFATSIHVNFPQANEFDIVGAGPDFELGMGSGQDFPVQFKNPTDPRATHQGFSVLVNAVVKSGNATTRSFTTVAEVPRNFALDPLPPNAILSSDACRTFFSPNGVYTVSFEGKGNPPPVVNFAIDQVTTCDPSFRLPGHEIIACFIGRADIPTANGNQSMPIDLVSARDAVGVGLKTQQSVELWSGKCDSRGLVTGNWGFVSIGVAGHEVPGSRRGGTFAMQQRRTPVPIHHSTPPPP
jgi:hypothetical protein